LLSAIGLGSGKKKNFNERLNCKGHPNIHVWNTCSTGSKRSPNTIRVTKSRKTRWEGHVAEVEAEF
jgi:hypothetical protein